MPQITGGRRRDHMIPSHTTAPGAYNLFDTPTAHTLPTLKRQKRDIQNQHSTHGPHAPAPGAAAMQPQQAPILRVQKQRQKRIAQLQERRNNPNMKKEKSGNPPPHPT